MKTTITKSIVAALLGVAFTTALHAQTSAFTYQGRLDAAGSPANGLYDLRFELSTNPTNSIALGVITNTATEISNGLFTVTLDFGPGAFDGNERWLEISARTNGGGAFNTLAPRQQVFSTPYAIKAVNAMTVDMGIISNPSFIGTTINTPLELLVNNEPGVRLEYPTTGTVPNLIGGYVGNTVGSGTQGAVIAGGGGPGGNTNSIGADSDGSVVGGGNDNEIGTNAPGATISGGWRNNVRASSYYSTVAGGYRNEIEAGSPYATIAGGVDQFIGANSFYSAIGGGLSNRIELNTSRAVIGGGNFNRIGVGSGLTTIGGGWRNSIGANSIYSTISGGLTNVIGDNAQNGVIAGGYNNSIGQVAYAAAIGGGRLNNIADNAAYAVVPGGLENDVGTDADYAFAAGRRAKANHAGTFVWADSQDADFASTSGNQFLIRASGGVGINTAFPNLPLANTKVRVGGGHVIVDNNYGFFSANSTNSALGAGMDTTPSDGLEFWAGSAVRAHFDADGDVGIGTTSPSEKLHVVGNILATGTITPNSDRNAKTDIESVDTQELLERVAALPIRQWRFKAEQSGVKHVGPMAQDFRAAFGLGAHETAIATVDADGVALAAIQGLNQKLEERDTEISELKQRLEKLEQQMNQN